MSQRFLYGMGRLWLVTTLVAAAMTALAPVALGQSHSPSAPSTPLGGVKQIAAGREYTCAVMTDGTARCWGDNFYGNLGDGTTTDRTLPVVVKDPAGTGILTGVQQIAAGDLGHTCAVIDDGTARCWGDNSSGQLGDGTTTDRTLPVVVKDPAGTGILTGVQQIAVGFDHTCAVIDDGTARCWGDNFFGELGDGTTTDRTLPVVVKDPAGTRILTGVKQIAAGFFHTCAVILHGTARCWGDNAAGQLGDGTSHNRKLPVVVNDPAGTGILTGVQQMAAGVGHTCAVIDDGTARCWGDNFYGNLGDGTTTDRTLPVVVKDPAGTGILTGVKQTAAGFGYTCAVIDDGSARCWGVNAYGNLGDGTITERLLPVVVKDPGGAGILTGVKQTAAGDEHTCAVMLHGTARCWGGNSSGQLGDGTTTDSLLPVKVKS